MTEISVIIPAFNSSGTIKACLESITSQSFRDIEIIVVDGLSKDDTLEQVKDLASKHSCIKFISEKDNGIYDAMNKGIEMAKGNWLYFLGSDDTLADAEVFADVHNVISHKKKLEFLYGNVRLVPSGIIYGGKFSWFRLHKQNISHQAIFYRRTLFEKIGNFKTRYKIVADWVFNIQCFKASINKKYIDRIIANFSEEGLSSNNKLDVAFRADLKKIMDENFPFYIKLWDYLRYRFK